MSELPVCILVGPAFCALMTLTADIVAADIDLLLARLPEIFSNIGRRQSLPHAHHGVVARGATQGLGRRPTANHPGHRSQPDDSDDRKELRFRSGAQADR